MRIPQFVKNLIGAINSGHKSISWSQEGTEFCIWNTRDFEKNVLPKFYRHNKFGSFVRQVQGFLNQLNMYGFNKICRQNSSVNFRHGFFLRDSPEKWALITRKKQTQKDAQSQNDSDNRLNELIERRFEPQPAIGGLFARLLEFKNQSRLLTKRIKSKVEILAKEVNGKKAKQIQPYLKSVKGSINCMEEHGNSLKSTLSLSESKIQGQPLVSRVQDMRQEAQPLVSAESQILDNERVDSGLSQLNEVSEEQESHKFLESFSSFKSISSFLA